MAALWVAIEWTHSYTGFEWLNLGNAGSGMSVPLRLAPITGVWGISFASLMAAALANRRAARSRGLRILWLVPLLWLVLLPEVPPVTRGTASAVVVQPNID